MSVSSDLQAYLETLLGVPVIFLDGNGPRPTLPYVTLKLISEVRIGEAHYPKANDSGEQLITYPIDSSFSIQSYGDENTLLQTISDSWMKQIGYEWLQLNGYALRSDNTINDITTLIDNTYETRYNLDIVIGSCKSILDEPNYVENFSGTGTINDINIDI